MTSTNQTVAESMLRSGYADTIRAVLLVAESLEETALVLRRVAESAAEKDPLSDGPTAERWPERRLADRVLYELSSMQGNLPVAGMVKAAGDLALLRVAIAKEREG